MAPPARHKRDIGPELVQARWAGTPWMVLEGRYGFCRARLWQLWRLWRRALDREQAELAANDNEPVRRGGRAIMG